MEAHAVARDQPRCDNALCFMQICHLRTAHPPRLSATGRFLPNMHSLASHADEGKRLLTVLLLQPAPLQPPTRSPTQQAWQPAAAPDGRADPSEPDGPAAVGSGHSPTATHPGHQHNLTGESQPLAAGFSSSAAGTANPAPTRDGADVEGGEIDWQHFTFSHGFRLPRLLLPSGGSVPLSKLPKDLQPADLTPDSLLQLDAQLKREDIVSQHADVKQEIAQAPTTSTSMKLELSGEEKGSPHLSNGQFPESASAFADAAAAAANQTLPTNDASRPHPAGSSMDKHLEQQTSSPSLQLKQECGDLKQESIHLSSQVPTPPQHALAADQQTDSMPGATGGPVTDGVHAASHPPVISSLPSDDPLIRPPILGKNALNGSSQSISGAPSQAHLLLPNGLRTMPGLQSLAPHDAAGELGEDGDISGGSDGDEDNEGKRMTTRSRRPRNQDHFMLNAGNVPVAQAAKVQRTVRSCSTIADALPVLFVVLSNLTVRRSPLHATEIIQTCSHLPLSHTSHPTLLR